MRLTDFIHSKPPELRIGQWFYINYCKDGFGDDVNLFNNKDDAAICASILNIMHNYQ